jgi:L-ascorbate metabolism protein UlaG (beta-lactamase superfamily)
MSDPPASLRYLGHATVLIELAGRRILTDPVLTDRIAFIRRTVAAPEAGHQQAIDAVLISHGHLDHLHRASLQLLGRDMLLIVPHGMGAMVRRWGFRRVLVADPHERFELGPLTVTATPAVHSGDRPPSGPRGTALGYLLEAEGRRIYFAGDTDLFDEMAELGPVDVALLPVAGYSPKLGPGHLDERRAAEAARLVQASVAVPIHWGTFRAFSQRGGAWFTGPGDGFAACAAELAPEVDVRVLSPGESLGL